MMISALLITAIVFASLYFLMVMYFFVGWIRLKKPSASNNISDSNLPLVSVVIPVRNESAYIKACLESIFAQNYPAHLFDVVVIDDYSTDPTLRFARELERENLLVIDLQQYLGNPGEYFPNKKKAIALGIKNAKGDLIITTDGDCTMGENWLRTMASYYESNNFKLITGPVLIKPARSPLAMFQQLDVINMLGITGATLRNGFPTMCNGANLMYSRNTFLEVEGFKGNHDVPTGDDIFLMQKINERYPGSVSFLKSFDACVFTKAENSLGGFMSQRMRWLSKTKHFSNFKITLMLVFAWVFNALIIFSTVMAFMPGEMNWLPVAVLGGAKFLSDFIFDIPITHFFRKLILLLLLPFIEIFHVLYIVVVGLVSLIGRYRWKDRLVK